MSEVLLNSGDGMKLFKEICRNPKNFDRYFILADWCEEQGDDVAAECWRLLGKTNKYPMFANLYIMFNGYKYWWCPAGTPNVPRSTQLSKLWLRHMSLNNTSSIKTYICRADGFNNAIVGWRRMKQKDRECVARIYL